MSSPPRPQVPKSPGHSRIIDIYIRLDYQRVDVKKRRQ